MGIGDEIMMAGEARRRAQGRPRRFLMLDKHGGPKWHFVWEGNPNVARPGEAHDETLAYSSGKRPYIADVKPERYIFREYSPAPAFIKLTPRAQQLARQVAGAVVFNPSIKKKASPNKDWGLERWKELIKRCPELRWICIGEQAMPRIRGAEYIPTPEFWDAVGAVSGARAVVVHEGALHHVAASFGTPAVVIRGGFISPRVTGYAGQSSLYVESDAWPVGCGMRTPCGHCRGAMGEITPALPRRRSENF
jgi:hypothetical protein